MFVQLAKMLFEATLCRWRWEMWKHFPMSPKWHMKDFEAIGMAYYCGAVFYQLPCPTWILGHEWLVANWRQASAKEARSKADEIIASTEAEIRSLARANRERRKNSLAY